LRAIGRAMNRCDLARFGDKWQSGASNAGMADDKRLENFSAS
jgi:hypothetical protein